MYGVNTRFSLDENRNISFIHYLIGNQLEWHLNTINPITHLGFLFEIAAVRSFSRCFPTPPIKFLLSVAALNLTNS